jgi:hypothetical protein
VSVGGLLGCRLSRSSRLRGGGVAGSLRRRGLWAWLVFLRAVLAGCVFLGLQLGGKGCRGCFPGAGLGAWAAASGAPGPELCSRQLCGGFSPAGGVGDRGALRVGGVLALRVLGASELLTSRAGCRGLFCCGASRCLLCRVGASRVVSACGCSWLRCVRAAGGALVRWAGRGARPRVVGRSRWACAPAARRAPA